MAGRVILKCLAGFVTGERNSNIQKLELLNSIDSLEKCNSRIRIEQLLEGSENCSELKQLPRFFLDFQF